MYILFNKDGSIFDTNVSEYVMQGSNLVNVIYVAFVDSEYLDWSASGNFTLPDESNSVLVGVSATFLYKGVNYTGWKITLTNNETKYNGTLGVSINLIKNEQILYTYLYNITINETGYPLDGEWNVNINYAQFNTLMAQIATKFGVGTTALTVEELPLQGSENIIYYLDKNGYYEQYMFNGSEYVLLGTTIFKINIPTINVSNSGTFSEGDYQTLEENHTISLVYSNNECILHQAKSALDTTSLYFTGITTNNNVVPTFICLKVLENRNYTLTVKQLVDTDSEQTLRNKTISNTTINNSTINGTNINNSHLNNTTSIGTFKVESGSITFGEESDPNQTTMYQDNLFVRNMNDRMQFKAGVLDYSKNAGSYGHYLFNDVPNQNVYLAYSVSNENSNIDNAFLGVRNDINSAKGDISSLQSDIDDINNELSTINGSITTIKNDVSTLKSNVSTLQGNVGTIQGDVSTINGEIDTINSDLDKKLNKLQLAQGNLLYARVNGIDLGAVYDTQAQANTIVARDNQGHVIGATPTDPTHLTTKSYVDSAIGSVSTIKFSIVSELPSTGESNIIYLVPNTTSSEKNVYDEYIWVNNAFEIIGSTAIDLTNYAKLNSDNIFTGVQYFNNTSGILIDGFKLNNAFLTNWRTKINKIDGIETELSATNVIVEENKANIDDLKSTKEAGNQDANDIKTNGNYYIDNMSNLSHGISSLINPSNSSGFLEVISSTNSAKVLQKISCNSALFERQFDGSTWSDWKFVGGEKPEFDYTLTAGTTYQNISDRIVNINLNATTSQALRFRNVKDCVFNINTENYNPPIEFVGQAIQIWFKSKNFTGTPTPINQAEGTASAQGNTKLRFTITGAYIGGVPGQHVLEISPYIYGFTITKESGEIVINTWYQIYNEEDCNRTDLNIKVRYNLRITFTGYSPKVEYIPYFIETTEAN